MLAGRGALKDDLQERFALRHDARPTIRIDGEQCYALNDGGSMRPNVVAHDGDGVSLTLVLAERVPRFEVPELE